MRKKGARTLTLKIFVETLLGRVENIAAVGEPRRIDQHVDSPEAAVGLGDHFAAVGDNSKVGLHERGRTASRLNLGGDALAIGFVAPAQH